MAYTDLYDIAPADYKLSLAVTLDHSVTHWVGQDWWWVDTLFMGLATMIKYANRTGDVRFLDTAFQEYKETTYGGSNITSQPGLWDPASNLYWRDHTFIKSRNTDGSKVFWARGNGWAAGAMALSLEALEGQTTTSSPAKAEFTLRLQHLAQGLAGAQGSDGLWRANLLDQSNPPNPESTGSNFFTFAMAYGVRTGILDRATYLPVVEKAWVGLSTISLQPNGLVGWCQPVGGSPEPATQLDTSDFCVSLWWWRTHLSPSGPLLFVFPPTPLLLTLCTLFFFYLSPHPPLFLTTGWGLLARG